MGRDRTTTSCLLLVASLVGLTAMVDTIAAQKQKPGPAEPASRIFPSDPMWTVDISAKPVTAPVASGDRLFVGLESGISARRLTDGSEIWNAKVTASGPMAVTGNRLIVPSKGEVHALETTTGATAWTSKVGDLTAPPVVQGDALLLATAKQLSAHRVADGSQTWTREVGVVEQRSAINGGRVYVPVSDGKLLVLDLGSGETVWETDVGIEPTEPLVHGDRLFFGNAAKEFCSFKLRDKTGAEDWCSKIGAVVVGAPVSDGVRVYCVALDNQLYAFDLNSGNRRWKTDLRYRPSSGPTIVGRAVTAPGREALLPSYDTVKGQPGAVLKLPATMVETPSFIFSGDGAPVKLAALHGGLENVWKLTLAWPAPPPRPEIQVVPLTELPGRPAPIGEPRALPE